MDDLKKRAEVIKGLQRLSKEFSGYKPNEEMFEMAIEALQTQKTGKWLTPREYCQRLYETTGERYLPAPTGLESFVYCSQCGGTSLFLNKYCPHCGSRNRGEDKE